MANPSEKTSIPKRLPNGLMMAGGTMAIIGENMDPEYRNFYRWQLIIVLPTGCNPPIPMLQSTDV